MVEQNTPLQNYRVATVFVKVSVLELHAQYSDAGDDTGQCAPRKTTPNKHEPDRFFAGPGDEGRS